MGPKFKIGQKVVVVDVEGSCATGISNGDILTVEGVWQDSGGIFGYDFKESGYALREHRIEAYEEKKTAEEIAPILWESYCNVLNEEALAALRQVIDDVENHEEMDFTDIDDITCAFTWSSTIQGEIFWDEVDDGKYDKTTVHTSQESQDDSMEHLKGTPLYGNYTKETDKEAYIPLTKPIKSDGGSSDYYKISVKTSHGMADVEVNDLIYALVGGDFDLGNCIKACRRMYLASKGCGKDGVDIAYDARKVAWFCADFQMRFGKRQ